MSLVRNSVPGRAEMDRQLAGLERELADAEANAEAEDEGAAEELMALAERLSGLHERIAQYDMHFTEHAAIRILMGLGFAQTDTIVLFLGRS